VEKDQQLSCEEKANDKSLPSALSLVLNTSNGALASPIPRGRSADVRSSPGDGGDSLGDVHSASPAGELLKSLVGELVNGNSES
jgi:hypothetical protein